MSLFRFFKKKPKTLQFRLRPMDRDYIKITVMAPHGEPLVVLNHSLRMLRYYAALGTKPPMIHLDGGTVYQVEYVRGQE